MNWIYANNDSIEAWGKFWVWATGFTSLHVTNKAYYKSKDNIQHQADLDRHIEELTLGFGILALVDQDLHKNLGCIGPFLKTKIFNTRLASFEDVKKLWISTGHGDNIQWKNIQHAVIVGVEDPDFLADDWTKEWDAPVKWSKKGQAQDSSVILINGNHRLEMLKQYVLCKRLAKLNVLLGKSNNFYFSTFLYWIFAGNQSTKDMESLQKDLRTDVQWTARIINLGNF